MNEGGKLLCIGPFREFDNTPYNVVLGSRVKVPYSSLVALLRGPDGYYAVVKDVIGRDHATPLPEQYEVIKELRHPRCPQCGSWNVVVDGDEMYCPRCRIEFWHDDVIWRAQEFRPEDVKPEVGTATLESFMSRLGYAVRWRNMAGGVSFHAVVVLEERDDNIQIGPVAIPAKKRVALGYVYDSCWDCEPEASFGVYEEVLVKHGGRELQFWNHIRRMTAEEADRVAEELKRRNEE
ncbi:MAG: hypothetical protein QXI07_11375 [Pyrobaculum sp.]